MHSTTTLIDVNELLTLEVEVSFHIARGEARSWDCPGSPDYAECISATVTSLVTDHGDVHRSHRLPGDLLFQWADEHALDFLEGHAVELAENCA